MTKKAQTYLNQTNHRDEDLDQFVQEYLQPSSARTVDQRVIQMLVDQVIPKLEGPNIIECGYGDGVWTEKVLHRFSKSHIVDASSKLLEVVKSKYGAKVTPYHAFFEEFTAPKQFDSVICTYILEHVIDPVMVLKQCRSWLKPTGLLFVAVPNATSLHRRLGVIMGMQPNVYQLSQSDYDVGHRRVYDAPKMEAELAEAGFKVVEKAPMMCKTLPNSILSHLSDKQLQGIFDLGEEIPENARGILAYFCRPA